MGLDGRGWRWRTALTTQRCWLRRRRQELQGSPVGQRGLWCRLKTEKASPLRIVAPPPCWLYRTPVSPPSRCCGPAQGRLRAPHDGAKRHLGGGPARVHREHGPPAPGRPASGARRGQRNHPDQQHDAASNFQCRPRCSASSAATACSARGGEWHRVKRGSGCGWIPSSAIGSTDQYAFLTPAAETSRLTPRGARELRLQGIGAGLAATRFQWASLPTRPGECGYQPAQLHPRLGHGI